MVMRFSGRNAMRGMGSTRDPMRTRTAVMLIILGAVVYALVLRWSVRHNGLRDGLIYAVAWSPIIIPFWVPGLLNVFPAFVRWTRERHFGRWQGRYYEFDRHQIRIESDRNGVLWFSLSDLGRVLKLTSRPLPIAELEKNCQRVAGTEHCTLSEELGCVALSETGLLKLLETRTDPASVKLRLWAQRDVIKPWHTRREREFHGAIPNKLG